MVQIDSNGLGTQIYLTMKLFEQGYVPTFINSNTMFPIIYLQESILLHI